MDVFQGKLKQYSAGKVLDFGTGEGASAKAIFDAVKGLDEVIGIDTIEPQREIAEDLLKNPHFRYLRHEKFPLPFESFSFDTVCMSHVVHHLPPGLRQDALRELLRVLRPGGTFLFVEGYRDQQVGARKTQVYWHSLRAIMDRDDGIHHYPTLMRVELVDMVHSLGFYDCEMFDFSQMREDFKEESNLNVIVTTMDQDMFTRRHLKRYKQYQRILRLLKQRMVRTGFLRAKALVAICHKAPPDYLKKETMAQLREGVISQ